MAPAERSRIELEGLLRVALQVREGAEEKLAPVLHRLVGDTLVLGRVAPVVLREDDAKHEVAPLRLQRPSAQIDGARVRVRHTRSFQRREDLSFVDAPSPRRVCQGLAGAVRYQRWQAVKVIALHTTSGAVAARSRRAAGWGRLAAVLRSSAWASPMPAPSKGRQALRRSEEHTSELQSRVDLVCRLLLEKKKKKRQQTTQPAPAKLAPAIVALGHWKLEHPRSDGFVGALQHCDRPWLRRSCPDC